MSRIEGVSNKQAGPLLRLIYRISRRKFKQTTGRETERMLEPVEVFAHVPKLLLGYGMFELASDGMDRVNHRLKQLAVLKAATLVHCEYCIDIGSSVAHQAGIGDEQLLALPHHRESDQFSDLEKLVLDYAVGVSRTPVEVSEELFSALRAHFDDRQLVELTSMIALENLRARFNGALGIGSANFTEGMVCAVPETSAEPVSATSAGAV
jgi:AhpD family alkylhydroperoxidase